jgi:hypothetical protein
MSSAVMIIASTSCAVRSRNPVSHSVRLQPLAVACLRIARSLMP